jgi:hypothetical protein
VRVSFGTKRIALTKERVNDVDADMIIENMDNVNCLIFNVNMIQVFL